MCRLFVSFTTIFNTKKVKVWDLFDVLFPGNFATKIVQENEEKLFVESEKIQKKFLDNNETFPNSACNVSFVLRACCSCFEANLKIVC